MPRSLGPTRLVVTVAALALLTTGCSDPADRPSTADPAPRAGAQRAQCTASDPQGELIVHPGSLTVTEETRLDDVRLVDSLNLEVVELAVTRFTGNPAVRGIIRDYPPLKNAGLVDSLADWDQRRPLPGLLLEPEDGPQAILVALRLVDPSRSGHLVGVTVSSSVAGTTSTQDYPQPVLVEPPDAVCTLDELDATLDWVP